MMLTSTNHPSQSVESLLEHRISVLTRQRSKGKVPNTRQVERLLDSHQVASPQEEVVGLQVDLMVLQTFSAVMQL